MDDGTIVKNQARWVSGFRRYDLIHSMRLTYGQCASNYWQLLSMSYMRMNGILISTKPMYELCTFVLYYHCHRSFFIPRIKKLAHSSSFFLRSVFKSQQTEYNLIATHTHPFTANLTTEETTLVAKKKLSVTQDVQVVLRTCETRIWTWPQEVIVNVWLCKIYE